MTPTPTPDLTTVKERQHKVWSSGDYGKVGVSLVVIGELLCEAVDVRSGQKVLDVATGSGNTAISAARRFCKATGIDYVPDLIEQARERAAAEGLDVAFEVGDAENLPYPDASFDVVLSTLGVMFTPDQHKAARELLRVCKPGGKIGLANWVPDGYVGNMLRTVGKHFPHLRASSLLPSGAPRIGYGNSWATASPRWRPGGAPTSSATSRRSTS
jgi:SAM-dependent methyltransferase